MLAMASFLDRQDEDDYTFDSFRTDPDKEPTELQLEELLRFLHTYSVQLRNVEDALYESFSDVWDWNTDPVGVAFEPSGDVTFFELVRTQDKLYDKCIVTLATLIEESDRLRSIAEEEFFDQLALLQHSDSYAASSASETSAGSLDGSQQVAFAKSLALFSRLFSFRNRCNAVFLNIIRQFQALYHADSPLFRQYFSNRIHITSVFSAAANVLVVLISLDRLLRAAPSIRNGCQAFRKMLRAMRSDPERFATTREKLARMESLVETLDLELFPGNLFEACLAQRFLRPTAPFMKEFIANLRQMSSDILPRLGEFSEAGRRIELVGLCAMCIVYCRVCAIDDDVKRIVKACWDSARVRAPLIPLWAEAAFCPQEFLLESCRELAKSLAGKDPSRDILEAKQSFLNVLDANLPRTVQTLYMEVNRWMVRFDSLPPLDDRALHRPGNAASPTSSGSSSSSNSSSKKAAASSSLLSSASASASSGGGTGGSALFGETDMALDFGVNQSPLLRSPVLAVEAELLCQGLALAMSCRQVFLNMLCVHSALDAPLTTQMVVHLFRCCELLKTIQMLYHRRIGVLGRHITYLLDGRKHAAETLLATRRPYAGVVDSPALLCQRLLKDIPSARVCIAMRLAQEGLAMKGLGFSKDLDDYDMLSRILQSLWLFADFGQRVRRACSCSFLFWYRDLTPALFQHFFTRPQLAHRLVYVFAALRDACAVNPTVMEADVMRELDACIVHPLCKSIENDLRLHIHTVVLGQQHSSVFGNGNIVYDFSRFLDLPKLSLSRKESAVIDIKARVAIYLSQTFYHLTCLAPHDWATYTEMANLARDKYGLTLAESYLPGATVDQGLDILDLTRNIHLFVSNFAYNMNTQSFIERTSRTSNKYLNTIQISHIANSIRTHGTGMMNTTVNFVYRFLARKFFVFSQFLYDDHIKSPLMKEQRFFRDSTAETKGQFYPMARADKFLKTIRKLGPYLEKFRDLVTEIGNAIGYVRMVRSGGLHALSESMEFVPDLTAEMSFAEDAKELSGHTQQAAGMLESVLKELGQKFVGGSSDYFSILAEVFRSEFSKDSNLHCKAFHFIVPPLTLSFAESMVAAKDRLFKTSASSKTGATMSAEGFSEDGFALGLAFILRLLDLNKEFDSLHWFEAAYAHYLQEEDSCVRRLGGVVGGGMPSGAVVVGGVSSSSSSASSSSSSSSMLSPGLAGAASAMGQMSSEDEMQTLQLMLARIRAYKREFELLRWTFNGASVLFFPK